MDTVSNLVPFKYQMVDMMCWGDGGQGAVCRVFFLATILMDDTRHIMYDV